MIVSLGDEPYVTFYSLRSELLVAGMDVSTCILVLDTFIFATSNLERREYYGELKKKTKKETPNLLTNSLPSLVMHPLPRWQTRREEMR